MLIQEKLLVSPAKLTLNSQQTNAVNELHIWWNTINRYPPYLLEFEEKFIGLCGVPGSGKSTCIWTFVAELLRQKPWAIAIAAPTHKAKDVLVQMALPNGVTGCKITTISSLLGVKSQLDDDGEDEYVFKKSRLKITGFDLVIFDESSMVSDRQWEYTKSLKDCPPLIAMGDSEQLRPVKSPTKSLVFTEVEQWITLTEPVRYDGRIKDLVTAVKDSRHFIDPRKFADGVQVQVLDKYEWIDSLAEDVANDLTGTEVRSLCFTNKLANWLNTNIHIESQLRRKGYSSSRNFFSFDVNVGDIGACRRVFGWQVPTIPEYEPGMFLVFNKAVSQWDGWAKERVILVNSGTVVKIANVQRHLEQGFNCSSLIVEWKDVDELGEIIGRSLVIFVLDDSDKKLFEETLEEMRQAALEYSNPNNPYRKQIFRERAKLRDNFANVSRTYASTIHKAQGSGFDKVYVHLGDILKCPDADMVKELIYTAYSRAKKKLCICV